MSNQDVRLLETTLRDGNYLVDFQFTAEDTAWLCGELERAGLDLIEIGHGLGLGASRVFTPAAATDEAYIVAARDALKTAQFGMFAIPGVATLEDLERAADLGMSFVRIGANVDNVETMEPFIAKARALGLFVSTNFMKSYCLPPKAFGEIGARAEAYGSQMNYLVDSAGGMLPADVRNYFAELADHTSIPMGFHGHDNIRMAVANSLVAIECGARYVDTTLFGIGRGSGNASTEIMAALLKSQLGAGAALDELGLLHLAERQVVPLLRNRRDDCSSISLGLAQVHSMYLDKIARYADAHDLDNHSLIREVGRIDRLDCDDSILAAAAERAVHRRPPSECRFLKPRGNGQADGKVSEAETIAAKLGVDCRLWILGVDGEERLDVNVGDRHVDIYVHGNPWEAISAAGRKPGTAFRTRLHVVPELKGALSGLEAAANGMEIVVAEAPHAALGSV